MEHNSERPSRKLTKHLIYVAWQHIDNDFGRGTAKNLLRLNEELFDAMEANDVDDTEESR